MQLYHIVEKLYSALHPADFLPPRQIFYPRKQIFLCLRGVKSGERSEPRFFLEFSFWLRENGTNFLIKSQENYYPWYVARRSRRLSMHVSQCSKHCCVRVSCEGQWLYMYSPRRAGTSLKTWAVFFDQASTVRMHSCKKGGNNALMQPVKWVCTTRV
jgi:hypothetical protein